MKHENDVEILFSEINENPDSYQEIVQHQDAMKSLERWPLIAVINHVTPFEVRGHPIVAPVLKRDQDVVPQSITSVSETISITETQLINTEVDDLANSNKTTPHTLSTDEAVVAPTNEVNHKTSEFVSDSRRSNKSASENISSIFERLKHS